jgi:hypothetical protein
MTMDVSELLQERKSRIDDAIALRTPDRVPVWLGDCGYFPAKYAGFTCEEAMFEPEKQFAAYRKVLTDFAPDIYFGPAQSIRAPGGAFEVTDCKSLKLPGRGASAIHSHQAVELESMKAEEYDEFLDDPVEFALRKFMPRIYGAMAPLADLPQLHGLLFGYGGVAMSSLFARPDIARAFEAFYKAGCIMRDYQAASVAFTEQALHTGFPLMFAIGAYAPFDVISDHLRGIRGTMTDMFRRPEKLLAAIDKLTPRIISSAIAAAKVSGNPGVFMALHRGAAGFMSVKQFETFYWPSLKKIILALVEADLTPCPFFEGDYGSRLEHLADLPKGRILGMFDNTDPAKAKEYLGGTMCIAGFMPLSVLQFGTPEEVKAQAKALIDIVGKDGGFIMGPKSIMDEAKPALVHAWMDFTREYGVYR